MKKKLLFVAILFVSASMANAQVGINTANSDPSAALDIVSTDRGLLIPRVFLPSYTHQLGTAPNAKGLLVYNTGTTGASWGQPLAGYYYWNNNKWNRLITGGDSELNEPWNVAGTTTPASSNTQNIYQTGKVGIGTNNPTTQLEVKATGAGNAFKMTDGTQAAGHVLTSDANGKASWQPVLKQPNLDGVFSATWSANAQPSQIDPHITAYGPFTVNKTGYYSFRSRWFWKQQVMPSNAEGMGYAWIQITTTGTNVMDSPGLKYEYRTVVNRVGPGNCPPSGFFLYLEANTNYYVHQYTENTEYPVTGERRFYLYYIQ